VYTALVADPIRILDVEREQDADGLIVTFSDGTTAGYITEELLALRPFREPSSTRSDPKDALLALENVAERTPAPDRPLLSVIVMFARR
jgi:hypothetical protein